MLESVISATKKQIDTYIRSDEDLGVVHIRSRKWVAHTMAHHHVELPHVFEPCVEARAYLEGNEINCSHAP